MKEPNTKRTRRRFSDEFKRECVALYKQQGITSKHVCDQFKIAPSCLARWVREYDPSSSNGKPSYQELERELRAVKGEMREMRVENRFLKKVSGFFASQQYDGMER